MWMVNSAYLCRVHLLGEHSEIHKHRHNFVKGHSIAGRRGQIEPTAMKTRHDELSAEIIRRGYWHESPYELPDLSAYDLTGFTVDRAESMRDLASRCKDCAERMVRLHE
jgi:hypothetical protein